MDCRRCLPRGPLFLLGAMLVAAAPPGCAGGSTAVAPDSPPVPLAAAEYYPLQPGWKWSYDIEKDGQHILAFYAVVSRSGDTAIVQAGDEQLSYAVTPLGIARKEGGVIGDFLIKDPLSPGATWSLAQGKAQVVSLGQPATVLAGTFKNCIVVEETRSEPTRIVRTTFAPGTGPISVEASVQDGGRFVTTMRASLRGMTRPGQDPLAM
ncbi:MAG TPA: hypothetical protein VMU50_22365 [Polyangia bacterium]|nr:hypothetical protein [Polyangia bacterium]